MHNRRFASLLLGGWMGCTVFMWVVAIQNFSSVPRALSGAPPQGRSIIQKIGEEDARLFLRYHASEENRWYFEMWEYMQLSFAVVVFLTLLFARPRVFAAIVLSSVILGCLLVERFLLTPNIVELGRAIDFLREGAQTAQTARFWIFHHSYSGVEMLKFCCGIVLAVRFLMISEDEVKKRSKRSKKPTTAMSMGE